MSQQQRVSMIVMNITKINQNCLGMTVSILLALLLIENPFTASQRNFDKRGHLWELLF